MSVLRSKINVSSRDNVRGTDLIIPKYLSITWGETGTEEYRVINQYRDMVSGLTPSRNIRNRAIVKLSSILTEFPSVFDSDGDRLKVCDLCGGPGSWSRLLLGMKKIKSVTGITLDTDNENFRWYEDLLGDLRFDPLYHDIVKDPLGLDRDKKYDLVVGDGGTGSGGKDLDAKIQLFKDRLILMSYQLAIAVDITDKGGSMIVKMFNPDNEHVKSIISIASRLYTESHVTKPLTSRTTSTEFYLVCINKKKESSLTEKIHKILNNNEYPLCDISLGEEYDIFADNVVAGRYDSVNNIHRFLDGKPIHIPDKDIRFDEYNVHEFMKD